MMMSAEGSKARKNKKIKLFNPSCFFHINTMKWLQAILVFKEFPSFLNIHQ